MRRFDPKTIPLPELQEIILCGVGPRPIALVSTLSSKGEPNLAPFSFFNAFSANPPVIVFSPARRGRDGSTKDTYENLLETRECVVHAVTYDIVEQVNIASAEFDRGINEFTKSGLTAIDSELVKAKRVKESPFHMECRLKEMIPLGNGKGSGNLAICEVVLFHVAEKVLQGDKIDPLRMDLAARNGGAYYTRSYTASLFSLPKPKSKNIIGYDGLPAFIKKSHVYSANDLARLANTEALPSREEVHQWSEKIKKIKGNSQTWFVSFDRFAKKGLCEKMFAVAFALHKKKSKKAGACFEKTAAIALKQGNLSLAWTAALYMHYFPLSS